MFSSERDSKEAIVLIYTVFVETEPAPQVYVAQNQLFALAEEHEGI